MKAFQLLMAVTAAAVLLAAASPSGASSPLEEVRSSVDAIMKVLQDETVSLDAKKAKVSAMVKERFDFPTMSRGVLATNWKKANAQERERFIELFSELLEATYRERINAYNNETVKYVGEKVTGKKAVVATIVVTADVEIPIEYKLLGKNGSWYAYDVVVEGVSLVRNYRDTYRDIVKREGIGGLLARMEEKIEELRRQPPGNEGP